MKLFKKDISRGERSGYPKVVTNGDMERGHLFKWWCHHCVFLKCSHFVCMKLSSSRSLSHVHTGKSNWCDQKGCDSRSMYNEENKTKEDESTLVNTIDNLFCSFIVNDANIAFCHLAFKMKNMHTYEPFEEWSDVVVSVRNEIWWIILMH